MSEQIAEAEKSTATGHPQVDDVISEVEASAQAPLEEQVATLTTAHETLRSILSDAGNDGT